MKTEQILNLDYRKEENKKIIQKVLRQVKPLSKFSDEKQIPIELLEKTVSVLTNKYEITPQWITCGYRDVAAGCVGYYSVGVKTTTDHAWLGNATGHTIYELFAKLTIKMYAAVRSGSIPERNMTKEEAQRERLAKKVDKQKEKKLEEDWSEN